MTVEILSTVVNCMPTKNLYVKTFLKGSPKLSGIVAIRTGFKRGDANWAVAQGPPQVMGLHKKQ